METKRVFQKAGMWLVGLVLGGAVLYSIGWLLWMAMLKVPPDWARGWALVATAILPGATWVGWYFGRTEARGRLAGIDQAVDKVMGAATRAASLRIGTAQALHQRPAPPPLSPPPDVVLPQVEIIPRQQIISGEIIEV